MHKKLHIALSAAVVAIASVTAPEAGAAMPGGSTIYGGLWHTDLEVPVYGIYSIGEDGAELLLRDPKGPEIGFPMRSAWIKDGKLCGYYVKESYSVIEKHYYIEADFETGEVELFTPLSVNDGYMFTVAYNPDDNNVYGYGLTGNYDYALMKASVDEPGNFQVIKTFNWTADEECLSIAYNTKDQKIYGINAKSQFVTVNPQTGQQTIVSRATVSGAQAMVSGMCYAPKEDLFYWNTQFSSSSAFYTIKPDGSAFTKVFDCDNNEQYQFLICPDKTVTAASPANPLISAVNFPNGALDGDFTLTMPSETVEGDALSGELEWTLTIDGAQHSSGEALPGADVTVPVTGMTEGNHVFTFKVTSDGEASENVSLPMWVGVDTPKAPATVKLTHDRVIWDAVTEGVNGGYVDFDNLEYVVLLNGEEAFTVGGDATEVYHNLSTAELKRYTANVISRAAGKEAKSADSNEVALGMPLAPSFTMIPDEEDVNRMTVIDVNGDGRTWSYSYFQECAKTQFGSGIPMDDWLIMSPVAFEEGTSYTLMIDVQICNSSWPDEYLRVMIGNEPTPEAMQTELIERFKPVRQINTWTAEFTVPTTNTYYIGFHTSSDPDMEGLLLSNIRLYPTGQNSIEDVTAPDSVTLEYFNLQGVKVENPQGGVFIERRGTEVRKVVVL